MSKAPGQINYPNHIDHQPTRDKLRELIDGHNYLHATVQQNQASAQKTAAQLAALPPSMTSSDVSMLIGQGLLPTGTITAAIKAELKKSGVTPALAKMETLSAMHWGKRTERPLLAREDSGFLYYVVDYGHCAYWDGWSWILLDGGGGYLVDSPVELGVGWQLCDGSATDYILQDTPDLAIAAFTTPKHRSLRHREIRRYFRR